MSQTKQLASAKQLHKREAKQPLQVRQVPATSLIWGQSPTEIRRTFNDTRSMNAANVAYLQRTIGNQVLARHGIIQRLEYPNNHKVIKSGDWRTEDRELNNDRWHKANYYNLMAGQYWQYRQIVERRDFYKWFYEYTAARGYHTRWALAAWIVANGANEIATLDYKESVDNFLAINAVNNELQGLMRIGNQVIFDDVFPKLRLLLIGGSKKGKDALDWDMRILSEEQQLVQPLYQGISPGTIAKLEHIAKQDWKAKLGAPLSTADEVEEGDFNKGGDVPAFQGNITNSTDRWKYGMKLGQTFSPTPTYGASMPTRPEPSAEYRNGSALKKVNVRPGLHNLDVMLNDADVPEEDVIRTIRQLTPSEQNEFLENTSRRSRLIQVLDWNEYKRAITSLRANLVRQMDWLEKFLTLGWRSVDYAEIKPMIVAAPQEQRNQLKNNRWMNVFVDICNDKNMNEALSDLKFDPVTRQQWTAAEK